MITAKEYTDLTGEPAPADFEACEAMACEMIHAHTLYAYLGRELRALPEAITKRLFLAVALQTQAISQAGGVGAWADESPSSVTLGRFSYAGCGNRSVASLPLSPAVRAILPILAAYGKGVTQCGPSRCGF